MSLKPHDEKIFITSIKIFDDTMRC